MEKRLLRALRGEALDPPPLWLMRQAGRYLPEYRHLRSRAGSFLDFCFTPELAAEATLQPVRRFGFDAAILFSDILVMPHALGQKVAFREGEGPVLEPVRSRDELAGLDNAGITERLRPVYEAVKRVKAALPPETALIGFAGAPWTVATYMVEGGASRDFAATKLWSWRDPTGFAELIERIIAATVEHLAAQVEAGAETVQLFDSWAGILAESEFERWVIAPTRQIVEALRRRHPELPVIGFPRGGGPMLERYLRATGVTALGLDATVPMALASRLQGLTPVQGNLEPLLLAAGGMAMEEGVRRILAALAAGPFVFNLGHGILPETPVGHVERLVAMVRHG